MKTIFKHTQHNVLVIPQALFTMQDVTVLKQHHNSVVFYKCLEEDLVDVEFYTNTPCFIYIESGFESLINSHNEVIELRAGSGVFLPQGLSVHSDFVKQASTLKAYLIFFDEDVIANYISHVKTGVSGQRARDYCLVQDIDDALAQFMQSMRFAITNTHYLNIKLQELLHLIAWRDDSGDFHHLLLTMNKISPKRNLIRLLEKHDILHLTVSDLAQISGRSVSSLNRDFKDLYAVTPKNWLQDKRLSHAKQLLDNQELSVTDVALEVGYENISSFIKAFKMKYGITPNKIKQAMEV